MAVRIPPAPDWLDELTLEPGPPWLTMGVRALAEPPLTPPTDDERALKARLLTDRRDEVVAVDADTEAAAARGARTRPAGRPRPIPIATRSNRPPAEVAEDLCLMVEHDGRYRLDAAVVCFPSYWRLAEKMGRTAAAIHTPVPHYADDLADRVDTFLRRLRPERPVWRRNWDLHDNPDLFAPIVPPPVVLDVDDVATGVWLRSEHQTLRRLPRSQAILFTIRTQQVPIGALVERPDVARRMAGHARGLPRRPASLAPTERRRGRRPRLAGGTRRPAALGGLDLDLDVDAGGQVEALQRVDRLGRRLEDVEQALVDAHLEVLAAVLVLVRRADDRVAVLLGGQRDRAPDRGLGAQHRLDDLLRRLVDDLVVVRLQPDADLLLVMPCAASVST